MKYASSQLCIVMWQRFGPYHLARLRAASEALLLDEWQVLGLEIAGADEYAWKPARDTAVGRETLFPDCAYANLSAREIRAAVIRTLDTRCPAAVAVNGWAVPEAVAALTWCRRSRARLVLMAETFQPSLNPVKEFVKRWRVARCDAALVGGRLQAAYLASLGFNEERIEVGYDVVDNAHFAGGADSPRWSALAARTPYFLANTRFLERKGVDALLSAYARYRTLLACESRAIPWQLVICGSGRMEAAWKALATSLGIDGHVHWPGFLQYDELPAAYRCAGAFVHPARREAWGLVVNEAAAAGLPLLVGHKVGAACELVREGANGFIFDPDDREAFARCLLRMSSLPRHVLAAMGRASQQIVAEFSPDRFGRALRKSVGLVETAHLK